MQVKPRQTLTFIPVEWPAPKTIKTLVTTRLGGCSTGSWASFNLATHVNDDPSCVSKNRKLLMQQGRLPAEPKWLNQTHTTKAVDLSQDYDGNADAAFTTQKGRVAVVMTADCLPLLVCNKQGDEIAAIHAGWKGLSEGIVTNTIHSLNSKPADLMVWIGPAISQPYFEVGNDVREAFCSKSNQAQSHFLINPSGKFQADMVGIVKDELAGLGVTVIYGGHLCSYAEEELFFSYRRDGITGRMASLIWIA
ncbi:MAG: peptidoglycan editing factor PgeF [Gammaproteobacteria bacterium]|nr:peptidoglycan editing factor PgeF [Gammaproteobacteria bacterium]